MVLLRLTGKCDPQYSQDNWAMSVCTVDGQRLSLVRSPPLHNPLTSLYIQGDVETPFTMQSCSKPFTYALCLSELGHDVVHQYIGNDH